MTKNADSVWETLSAMDMSHAVEVKNGFSYLSWAHAWIAVKDRYPKATFKKHCDSNGLPFFKDEMGNAYVAVTVQIEEETATEVFPVLDYKHKPIKNPGGFDVNTALQRCMTKCLGYLGLGCYLYAGEDLPFGEAAGKKTIAVKIDGETQMLEMVGDDSAAKALIEAASKAKSLDDLSALWSDNKETIGTIGGTFKDVGASIMKAFSVRKTKLKEKE